MANKISASVGKGGKNKAEDVKIVQELLNDFTKMCGFKKLDVDGLIGPKTLTAIAEFQKTAVGMAKPDSRIDTNGDSFSTLSKGPKKAEAEVKKAEQAGKEKQEAEEAKKAAKEEKEAKADGRPQIKGDYRSLDKKLLAILEAVSAHYGKPIVVESAKQATANQSADQMWDGWETKFKRGDNLGLGNRLREDLDKLYNDVNKDGFAKLVAKSSGNPDNGLAAAHADGKAVDIKRNTDSKMLDALASILRCEKEGDVFHFDTGGKSVPNFSEDMKKKWK